MRTHAIAANVSVRLPHLPVPSDYHWHPSMATATSYSSGIVVSHVWPSESTVLFFLSFPLSTLYLALFCFHFGVSVALWFAGLMARQLVIRLFDCLITWPLWLSNEGVRCSCVFLLKLSHFRFGLDLVSEIASYYIVLYSID